YLRQFAPHFLNHLSFRTESAKHEPLLEAIDLLRKMNAERKRKIPDPENAPREFIPPRIQRFVFVELERDEAGDEEIEIDRQAYECALLTAIRDEIKRGNLWIAHSKRFGRLDDFFISDEEWATMRTAFFQRAGLPVQAADVGPYLTDRLNRAFDRFLHSLPNNAYVSMDEDGWRLGSDRAETLDPESKQKLTELEGWLAKRMKIIKLPDLLIEVDNELHFTHHFIPPSRRKQRQVEDVCTCIATIMAYGCNIGPYTMAQLTPDISYEQINTISDWYLHEETLRRALADVVNAITDLDTVRVWGEGKTSSSDGQRFLFPQKVLQRTYSPRFGDFALEFYSFIADNYAPFYSQPIECSQRDAPYVLDGLLYHESDLDLEEHYTDTHGYTEINFASFAMLGRRFRPRIRGLQRQRIYRIDKHKDYGPLNPLVTGRDHTIHLDWIVDQWDRMGQFYASLEAGHTTASIALKRLMAYSSKNEFYRANHELGRVFKTEFILQYNSDVSLRRRIQRGLLKGEQLHQLAREVFYGKRGRVTARDFQQQMNTASCLILILACIIYWQAREIGGMLHRHTPEEEGVDTSLLAHISPIGWDNVLLYGEYVINPNLVY
ncbi:MAG: Tn3 family transposase, partial [Candidatus Bipolaricaulia bacterium]